VPRLPHNQCDMTRESKSQKIMRSPHPLATSFKASQYITFLHFRIKDERRGQVEGTPDCDMRLKFLQVTTQENPNLSPLAIYISHFTRCCWSCWNSMTLHARVTDTGNVIWPWITANHTPKYRTLCMRNMKIIIKLRRLKFFLFSHNKEVT
jgi:hypothetical protein